MKYKCVACSYIYDEEKEGVKFKKLPKDWTCPTCGATKSELSPTNIIVTPSALACSAP